MLAGYTLECDTRSSGRDEAGERERKNERGKGSVMREREENEAFSFFGLFSITKKKENKKKEK